MDSFKRYKIQINNIKELHDKITDLTSERNHFKNKSNSLSKEVIELLHCKETSVASSLQELSYKQHSDITMYNCV